MIFQKLIRTWITGPILGLLMLAFGATVTPAQQVPEQVQVQFPVETVKIQTAKGVFSFKTEIAITDQQRQTGLMFRKVMADDAAMLFRWQYPQPISMWMKNTYLSLDMIFIRPNGQVANVGRATRPLSLDIVSSLGPVSAVLEVIAGTADRIGLKAGDMVFLSKPK